VLHAVLLSANEIMVQMIRMMPTARLSLINSSKGEINVLLRKFKGMREDKTEGGIVKRYLCVNRKLQYNQFSL
jgi:hypothetical protein